MPPLLVLVPLECKIEGMVELEDIRASIRVERDAVDALLDRGAGVSRLPSITTATALAVTWCFREIVGEVIVCTDDVSEGFRVRVGVVSSLMLFPALKAISDTSCGALNEGMEGRIANVFFIVPGPARLAFMDTMSPRFEDGLGSTILTVRFR